MIRLVLLGIGLFVTPALIWFGWRFFSRRRAAAPAPGRPVPWAALIAAGLALVVVALVVLGSFDGEAGREWVPPRYEDGRLVPGYYR